MRPGIGTLLAAALAMLSVDAAAGQCQADVERLRALLDRADLSFSPITFGTMRSPPSLGLRELNENGCQEWGECEWIDARGVRHFFWEDDELVVKIVEAREIGDNPIAALGIGRARSREAVIANVRAFLPEVELLCQDALAAGDPGEGGPGSVLCEANLGEGWFKLWFDPGGTLTRVRLDARHFT